MVNALAGLALWALLAAPDRGASISPAAPAPAGGDGPVRSALAGEKFPWYDAEAERVRPVLPREFRASWLEALGERVSGWLDALAARFRGLNRWRVPGLAGLGDLVAIGLAMLLLTVVLVGLLELLRRYRPVADEGTGRAEADRAGSAGRIEGLPAGVRFDAADPWAEAQRLRAIGDRAGAVVYLFAHQLLTLDRLRHVRIVPGRTGRQLVRSVGDRPLRALVEPTLRLFESVYYGHDTPSAEAFEAVWALAQSFEERTGAGALT